jgi:hypothetical protein
LKQRDATIKEAAETEKEMPIQLFVVLVVLVFSSLFSCSLLFFILFIHIRFPSISLLRKLVEKQISFYN